MYIPFPLRNRPNSLQTAAPVFNCMAAIIRCIFIGWSSTEN